MWKRFRQGYRRLMESRPGRRFQELQARRARPSGGKARPWQVVKILFALLVIAAGLVLIPIPGPGITLTVVGCGLLAAESRIMARLLDRAELFLRRWWPRLKSGWRQLPVPVRWLLGAAAAALVLYLNWAAVRPLLGEDPLG